MKSKYWALGMFLTGIISNIGSRYMDNSLMNTCCAIIFPAIAIILGIVFWAMAKEKPNGGKK